VLLSTLRGVAYRGHPSRRARIRLLLPERALVRPRRNEVGECTPITQDRVPDVCPSRSEDA
jgi:hypothetical protein